MRSALQTRLKPGEKFMPEQTEELSNALEESCVKETVKFATKTNIEHKDNVSEISSVIARIDRLE